MLGCPFFWLLVLWASKEKLLAEWRKGAVKYPKKYLIRPQASAARVLFHTKLSMNLGWILAYARMTV